MTLTTRVPAYQPTRPPGPPTVRLICSLCHTYSYDTCYSPLVYRVSNLACTTRATPTHRARGLQLVQAPQLRQVPYLDGVAAGHDQHPPVRVHRQQLQRLVLEGREAERHGAAGGWRWERNQGPVLRQCMEKGTKVSGWRGLFAPAPHMACASPSMPTRPHPAQSTSMQSPLVVPSARCSRVAPVAGSEGSSSRSAAAGARLGPSTWARDTHCSLTRWVQAAWLGAGRACGMGVEIPLAKRHGTGRPLGLGTHTAPSRGASRRPGEREGWRCVGWRWDCHTDTTWTERSRHGLE